ncbi:MAG TPA: HK97 family phage prohead protease, partial [Phycisphaerae bacterium]|nr:HK97 family phage prohead protease [Phycisphaerae bacterium]
ELRELMLDGAVDGLSIGFQAIKDYFDEVTGVRHLVEINLWEISLCCFPACPGTSISNIKHSTLPDPALATPAAEDNDPAIGHSFEGYAEALEVLRKFNEGTKNGT